jgi:acyl carrier protein
MVAVMLNIIKLAFKSYGAIVMEKQQIKETVLRILVSIAPDADVQGIKPNVSFHDQLEIDSIDFLRLMTALEQELQVEIPDLDFPKLSTLQGCVNYLAEKIAETEAMVS